LHHGRGRIDRQSLDGKVVAGVAALAAAAGVEVIAIGGSVDPLAIAELRERGVTCVALIDDPRESRTCDARRAGVYPRGSGTLGSTSFGAGFDLT